MIDVINHMFVNINTYSFKSLIGKASCETQTEFA